MATTEKVYFWRYTEPGKRKPQVTRWRCTEEEARARFTDPQPVPGSEEVRTILAPEEFHINSTSRFQHAWKRESD